VCRREALDPGAGARPGISEAAKWQGSDRSNDATAPLRPAVECFEAMLLEIPPLLAFMEPSEKDGIHEDLAIILAVLLSQTPSEVMPFWPQQVASGPGHSASRRAHNPGPARDNAHFLLTQSRPSRFSGLPHRPL
jgi:hypothetical protein